MKKLSTSRNSVDIKFVDDEEIIYHRVPCVTVINNTVIFENNGQLVMHDMEKVVSITIRPPKKKTEGETKDGQKS